MMHQLNNSQQCKFYNSFGRIGLDTFLNTLYNLVGQVDFDSTPLNKKHKMFEYLDFDICPLNRIYKLNWLLYLDSTPLDIHRNEVSSVDPATCLLDIHRNEVSSVDPATCPPHRVYKLIGLLGLATYLPGRHHNLNNRSLV
jgi:hypothetical protein